MPAERRSSLASRLLRLLLAASVVWASPGRQFSAFAGEELTPTAASEPAGYDGVGVPQTPQGTGSYQSAPTAGVPTGAAGVGYVLAGQPAQSGVTGKSAAVPAANASASESAADFAEAGLPSAAAAPPTEIQSAAREPGAPVTPASPSLRAVTRQAASFKSRTASQAAPTEEAAVLEAAHFFDGAAARPSAVAAPSAVERPAIIAANGVLPQEMPPTSGRPLADKRSSGLAPPLVAPGQVALSDYRYPLLPSAGIQALRVLHYGSLALYAGVLATAVGWPALAAPAAIAAVATVKALRNKAAFDAYVSSQRAAGVGVLDERGAGPIQALWSRLGSDPRKAPLIQVESDPNAHFGAFSIGNDLSEKSYVKMTPAITQLPPHQIAGVIAHELGHLHGKDSSLARQVLRNPQTSPDTYAWLTFAGVFGPLLMLSVAALTAVLGPAHAFYLSEAVPYLVAALAAPKALGMSWLFGAALTRAKEYRADHFSAWLAGGAGLRDFLKTELNLQAPPAASPKERLKDSLRALLKPHPPLSARVSRLDALEAAYSPMQSYFDEVAAAADVKPPQDPGRLP